METSQDILAELVCGHCNSLLRQGPVFMRQDGTTSCNTCQEKENTPPASRIRVYEAIARALTFPCRYREQGCPASVPFTPAGASGPEHEANCPFRNTEQSESTYFQQIQGMETVQHILSELVCSHCNSLLRQGPVFMRQDGTTSCNTCQEKEDTPPASRIRVYEAIARALTFPCRYREQGCPASVPFTPAGASGPEHEAVCPFRNTEVCGKCKAPTARVYKDEDRGWICEKCAPEKLNCFIERCDYEDYPKTRDKHSWLLCAQRKLCYICEVAIQPGTLAQHYPACPRISGVEAGAGYRVTRNPRGSRVTWFRLENVLCQTWHTEDRFWLQVFAPAVGPQLARYSCEVRLDCEGQTRKYAPELMYHRMCDWEVECKDKEFLKGDVTVYVNVTCSE